MIFHLRDWTFDSDRNLLIRGEQSIRLEPKAADVLRVLCAAAGQVVSKQELIAGVWGDIAVSDEVLTTAVYQVRRALGDDRTAPRFIETVPRRGYRVMVQAIGLPQRGPAKRWLWVAAVTAFAIVAALLGLLADARSSATVAAELHRVAVANLHRGIEFGSTVLLLQRASDLDPQNASITSSLALALALQGEDLEAARVHAERALRSDPRNPDALIARGLVSLWADWNWHNATRDLRLAARHGSPTADAWLAYVTALAGNREPAIAAAHAVDGSPIVIATASTALLLSGAIDSAENLVADALRRDPANAMLIRQRQKIRDRRLEAAGTSHRSIDPAVTTPTEVARLHLAHGDVDAALDALEAAWRQRDARLLYLRVDTRWDPIRSHPRFRTIAANIGP